MKYQVVMPWVDEGYKNACLTSCRFDKDSMLLVDNRIANIGVSASWNRGIDEMKRRNADWLIIMSAAMRFGLMGGLDFIKALETYPDDIAVEAAPHVSWHLIAFNKRTIDRAGRFDENFYPGYYEDLDYANRVYLTHDIDPPYWRKVNIGAWMQDTNHGVRLGGIHVDDDTLQAYFKKKWGKLRGKPKYKYPFNDPNNSIKYWPEPVRGGKWDAS